MIRTVLSISSVFLILIILGLKTEQAAAAAHYAENIQKLMSLIKNFERGYNYSRKNNYWKRNDDPLVDANLSSMEHEYAYIYAQANDSANFSDLHSIFVVQSLAMIYAMKLRAKSYATSKTYMTKNTYERITVYKYFAKFGADSVSVGPTILRMLRKKSPKSYEEFEQISKVFDALQTKVMQEVFGPTVRNEEEANRNKEELNEDIETLVKYIKTAFIQVTDRHSTGLGIDGGTDILRLPIDTHSLESLVEESPNNLFSNFDKPNAKNMHRSAAMRMMIQLLDKISTAITQTVQVAVHVNNYSDIESFVHVRRKQATNALIFVEIPYNYIENMFPARRDEPEQANSSLFGSFRSRLQIRR